MHANPTLEQKLDVLMSLAADDLEGLPPVPLQEVTAHKANAARCAGIAPCPARSSSPRSW